MSTSQCNCGLGQVESGFLIARAIARLIAIVHALKLQFSSEPLLFRVEGNEIAFFNSILCISGSCHLERETLWTLLK